ncbi:MAG: class I SAM-dependent methyltransferase [Anaerolineales bacterium]|jgi:2-polyprenyl-3-methyl-5-hydroxy-6-metoxy-1,4-benzoquinol methylase|nr:class I SAM-dependent methyltransferase [Anaerolineales bacterium]
MPPHDIRRANLETLAAWNANASAWDARMGEGNDFVEILQWPAILRLLAPQPGQHILDAACGNGLMARRLAAQGASITAFDFSSNLVDFARQRTETHLPISYYVLDATEPSDLEALAHLRCDSVLCNMALFDIANVEPLFNILAHILKPGGVFVFSLMHPAFNNPSSVHSLEESDLSGEIITQYAIKSSRYMSHFQAHGLALRNQPKPQLYFHRPLDYYLNLGFQHGFTLDGFEERAFPPEIPASNPLAWGGQFHEFPPVLVARMRLNTHP